MAQAKKCDRCGAFYEEVDAEPSAVEILVRDAAEALFPSRTRNCDFVRGIEETVDLCTECLKSLKAWWNMKGGAKE